MNVRYGRNAIRVGNENEMGPEWNRWSRWSDVPYERERGHMCVFTVESLDETMNEANEGMSSPRFTKPRAISIQTEDQ